MLVFVRVITDHKTIENMNFKTLLWRNYWAPCNGQTYDAHKFLLNKTSKSLENFLDGSITIFHTERAYVLKTSRTSLSMYITLAFQNRAFHKVFCIMYLD